MLVEFRVKNFRSIKDEQVLSMVASGDKSLLQNCIETKGMRLLKGAAVYGPNAAGKSNLVRALKTMRQIVVYSTDNKPGDSIRISSFAFDSEIHKEPTEFEVTFIYRKMKYQYGFSILNGKVHEEWLFAFPSTSAQKWFERTSTNKKEPYTFGANLKGRKKQIEDSTKNNTLFLSMAAQLNHEQLTPIFNWFEESFRVIPPSSKFYPITAATLDEYKDESKIEKWVLNFLRGADLGISGLKVKKIPFEEALKEMPEELRNKLGDKYGVIPKFDIDFIHEIPGIEKPVSMKIMDESDGTRRLFELSVPCLMARDMGYTLIMDEVEASLHPLLIRNLVKYFMDKENSKGAQLIFTTHNTTLLDPELLRRDQVWFCERDEALATHLYSLWDYRPRKGESLEKGYLAGRYGAIPILKAFGEKE
ncbi:MAG: ATP-binding protein [Phycisphaerae bacterium]|nr:ATP-binding protein [Phycisphaerae bacterium]